jgi:hypothetical protein
MQEMGPPRGPGACNRLVSTQYVTERAFPLASALVATKSPKQQASVPSNSTEDVAVVCGKSEDGAGLRILRKRADRVEVGEIRPLEHGKPLGGEVVRLRQRGDSPVFDVQVQVPAPAASALSPTHSTPTHSGPAQVATEQYRQNWDAIWSDRKASGKKLLN